MLQSTTASNDGDSNVEIMCRAQSMCVSMTSEFMNDLWPDAQIEELHFQELCDDYSLSVSDLRSRSFSKKAEVSLNNTVDSQ